MLEKLKHLPEIINEFKKTSTSNYVYFVTSLYFTTRESIEGCTKEEHDESVNTTAVLISNINNLITDIDKVYSGIREYYDELVSFYGETENDPDFVFEIDKLIEHLAFFKASSNQILELVDLYVSPKL